MYCTDCSTPVAMLPFTTTEQVLIDQWISLSIGVTLKLQCWFDCIWYRRAAGNLKTSVTLTGCIAAHQSHISSKQQYCGLHQTQMSARG